MKEAFWGGDHRVRLDCVPVWNVALALCIRTMIERQALRDGLGFPGGASGKESACQCRRHKRHRFDPWIGKIPWRMAWQPTPVSLPGNSHGQRSLVGYRPCGRRVGHNLATEQQHLKLYVNIDCLIFF